MKYAKVLECLVENYDGVTAFCEHINTVGEKYLSSIEYHFNRHDLWNWIKREEVPIVPAFILAKILKTHPIVFNFNDGSILYGMDEDIRDTTIKNFKLLTKEQQKALI